MTAQSPVRLVAISVIATVVVIAGALAVLHAQGAWPFVASPGEVNLTEAEPRAKDESWSDRRAQPGQTELRQVKE